MAVLIFKGILHDWKWNVLHERPQPLRFTPHTIAVNADNGPENNSRRSQFMKRRVEFAVKHEVGISLIYYPPYHSKYNPIERVWGVLENHWRGQLLDSVEKVVGLAKSMKYNGKNPLVKLIRGT